MTLTELRDSTTVAGPCERNKQSIGLFISLSAQALDAILDLVALGLLAMNGIQPELNPCSGNSTVSDFRLNKGTMFYFYPCLRRDSWLTRTPKLLLVPQMCACACVCVRIKQERYTELQLQMQKQREQLLSAACQALTRALTPAPRLPPSTPPQLAGASLPSPADEGNQVKWAIVYSGTGTLHCPALWNACSLCQINTPSFLSMFEIDSEGGKCAWERRFSVFVCARVRAWGEGRVLAAHLMIFSLAVYWLSECCWRKMENALHKVKRHAILL